MKHIIKYLFLALAMTVLVYVTAACFKSDPTKLDVKQSEKLLNIAEAFYESGENFNNTEAIGNRQLEYFMYYYYNDELEAQDDGYASLPVADADALVTGVFGFAPTLRSAQSSGERPFYFEDGKYYFEVKSSDVVSSSINSVSLDDDGNTVAVIALTDASGVEYQLRIVFVMNGEDMQIISCSKFMFS